MAKKDEEKKSGGYTSFRDRFDGGGAGRSGASFEGSPLSTFGNALGIRPSGSDRPNPRQSAGFGDFMDGGGYGRSGQRFSGSPYSILANALGIKPMGYEDRMAAARPQMRPTAPTAFDPNYADRFAPMAAPEAPTATSIAPPSPVDVSPIGAMPMDMLIQIANQGIENAGQPQMGFVPTNTLEYGDPLGREVNPLYVNYPFMRY